MVNTAETISPVETHNRLGAIALNFSNKDVSIQRIFLKELYTLWIAEEVIEAEQVFLVSWAKFTNPPSGYKLATGKFAVIGGLNVFCGAEDFVKNDIACRSDRDINGQNLVEYFEPFESGSTVPVTLFPVGHELRAVIESANIDLGFLPECIDATVSHRTVSVPAGAREISWSYDPT